MTSTIKVNNVQASDGGNIINQCGTTITLGASGDSIALASGASQTGFGREGSVDWVTDSIKTATFTAVSGKGYFCNTNGGAFTVNLPAGSAGAIVSVSDYTRTFNASNLTVSPNGSEKIGGIAADATLTVNGQSATFVYVDGTEGWINVQETQTSQTGTTFITATGGTITTSGNDKIHTFTSPGTFCVSQLATCSTNNQVSYIVVAGGGGGGCSGGGGGGAGGFREDKSPATPYTSSPLEGAGAITVTATGFPITVGGGGAGGTPGTPATATPGVNSVFSTTTSAGGGGGGSRSGGAPSPATANGLSGGSGGGGGGGNPLPNPSGGSGNTPPVSPPQGNNGGGGINSPNHQAGGGGGAGGVGTAGTPSPDKGGPGGAGVTTEITASPVARAGGGGGGNQGPSAGCATAGGGNGGIPSADATDGTANTGGGGGGAGFRPSQASGNGGSGVVIIRYKYQ